MERFERISLVFGPLIVSSVGEIEGVLHILVSFRVIRWETVAICVSSQFFVVSCIHCGWGDYLGIRTLHNQTSPHNVDSLDLEKFSPLKSLIA